MRRWGVALALGLPGRAFALDLLVSGAWSPSVGPADLQSGAGTDLVASRTSNPDQILVDVASTAGPADAWEVQLRRSTVAWPAGVRLWARRSSDGAGPGSVSGGATWREVTALDGALFQGQGDRTGIGIELELTGLAVGVAPDTYATSITYTVVDR